MDADQPVNFTIDCTGNITKKKWWGKFLAKPVLSHMDRMTRDRLRREYLGVRSEEADAESKSTAVAFSELDVRLTKWPEWWQAADFGKNMQDTNVISEIYRAALKVEADFFNELVGDADKAEKDIKVKANELADSEK